MLTYKTPGVYIEELPAVGPIEGLGTSTAAFIGPAADGPIGVPTKITNWSQFTAQFGGYIGSPRIYLPHAVRGFFENGGTVAYVVRVGTGKRAFLELNDRKAAAPAGRALRIEARKEGPDGNSIRISVQDAQIVDTAEKASVRKARAPIKSAADDTIVLDRSVDGALFKPGDIVTVEGSTERVEIDRIAGDRLILANNLTASHDDTKVVRIADLRAGQKTFRLQNGRGIERGSVIHLAQGQTAENRVVDAVTGEFITLAAAGLAEKYDLAEAAATVTITSLEFNLSISNAASPREHFTKLSMDPRHSRYFGRVVNSALVTVSRPAVPSVETPPNDRPAVIAGEGTLLANGAADKPNEAGPNDYKEALRAMEKVDDVNLLCVPDRTDDIVQTDVVDHCERMADRFAILDSAFNVPPSGGDSVLSQRASVGSKNGYAGLYYPWLRISDPTSVTGEDTLLVPPSGHLAGVFARSDSERGVHKAPANEMIRGAIGLERVLDDVEQGELNIEGVNVLRTFAGKARPMVWGARTTAPREQTAYRYVNVRRLLLFIEESIQEGIQWAVFEPNNIALWKKLHRTITEFLTRVWRSGALFGATPAEAFYVKIDDELNPAPVRNLGQVVIEVGVAPVRPAEFVIVRIGLWDGGAEVSES